MEQVAASGLGVFVVKTVLDVVKGLLTTRLQKFLPLFSLILGIVYSYFFVDGTIEIKLAGGFAIGLGAVGVHETTKITK